MQKNAKTEHTREDARQQARLAFIAEWKAVTGTPPSWVDDRGFSKDDVLIKYLYEATEGDGCSKTGKIKWWLANNWIGKKLFIMKPKQLAECYLRETGQDVIGETLARYSRDMGLKNMRKQGPAGPSIQRWPPSSALPLAAPAALVAFTGDNADFKLPYRLPVSADTHEPNIACYQACLQQASELVMAYDVQYNQAQQRGYGQQQQ